MSNLSSLTVSQLERAVAIKRQIEILVEELESLNGNGAATPAKRGRKKGWSKLKAAAETIEATRKSKGSTVEIAEEQPRKKRKVSREAKAKMAASQKARWEKFRAAQAAA